MYGGKLLGQGAYGCAFNPPLKCRGKPKNPTDIVEKKVGKLTHDMDAYWESIVSKRLAQNQLAKNYFILIEDTCILDNRQSQNEPDLAACKPIKNKKLTAFKQISMPYGGTALSMAKFNLETFDIVTFMKHLLEAGSLMLLSGVTHRDLHMGNIVIDKYGVPRIIDFGLSLFQEQLNTEILQYIQHPPDFHYNQEPPEVSLFWAIYGDQMDEETPYDIVTYKPVFKDIHAIFGIRDSAEKIADFWEDSKSLQDKDGVALLKTFWPQYDAWSIGVVMVELIRGLTFFKEFQNNQIYSRNKQALEKIVKMLVEPSPKKRPDAIQALSEFVKTVPDGDESFVLSEFCGEWLSEREKQQSVYHQQQY